MWDVIVLAAIMAMEQGQRLCGRNARWQGTRKRPRVHVGKAAGFCGPRSSEKGMGPGGPETTFSERHGGRAALLAA